LGLLNNEDYTGQAMLNAWLGIILCRRLRDVNPCLKDQFGRPKTRREDVLEDIKSINICNWKKVAHNRDRWKRFTRRSFNFDYH